MQETPLYPLLIWCFRRERRNPIPGILQASVGSISKLRNGSDTHNYPRQISHETRPVKLTVSIHSLHTLAPNVCHPPRSHRSPRAVECLYADDEDCTIEVCGSTTGYARYSETVVLLSAAVAGILVTALGTTYSLLGLMSVALNSAMSIYSIARRDVYLLLAKVECRVLLVSERCPSAYHSIISVILIHKCNVKKSAHSFSLVSEPR